MWLLNMIDMVESMRGKRSISNARISRYVDECISDMKKLKFGFADEEKFLTYDDIDIEEGSTIQTYGVMSLPRDEKSNFKLVLNQHMFNDPEETIKNTIYHELCHYVVEKFAINLGVTYFKGTHWYYNRSSIYNISDFKSHGHYWKHVSAIVGRSTQQNIVRTHPYETHAGVGLYAETKYNYIVKCKHCSKEFKYAKRSKFIAAVLDGNGHVENW